MTINTSPKAEPIDEMGAANNPDGVRMRGKRRPSIWDDLPNPEAEPIDEFCMGSGSRREGTNDDRRRD